MCSYHLHCSQVLPWSLLPVKPHQQLSMCAARFSKPKQTADKIEENERNNPAVNPSIDSPSNKCQYYTWYKISSLNLFNMAMHSQKNPKINYQDMKSTRQSCCELHYKLQSSSHTRVAATYLERQSGWAQINKPCWVWRERLSLWKKEKPWNLVQSSLEKTQSKGFMIYNRSPVQWPHL